MKKNVGLTYQQALAVIEEEEQKMRNIHKDNLEVAPRDVDKEVGFYSTIKVLSLSLAGTLSLPVIVVTAPGVISVHSTFPLAIFCMVVAASSTCLQAMPALSRFISPKKYRKMQDEVILQQRLMAIKEQNLSEMEQKSLQKTQKALDVINSSLQDSKLRMVYRKDEDFQGFVFISSGTNKQALGS